MRPVLERLFTDFSSARQVKCEPVSAGGVKAEWITAPNAAADRAILYLHGGGYRQFEFTSSLEIPMSETAAAPWVSRDFVRTPDRLERRDREDIRVTNFWRCFGGCG